MKIIVSGTRNAVGNEGLVVDLYREISLPAGRSIKVFRSSKANVNSDKVNAGLGLLGKDKSSTMGLF